MYPIKLWSIDTEKASIMLLLVDNVIDGLA